MAKATGIRRRPPKEIPEEKFEPVKLMKNEKFLKVKETETRETFKEIGDKVHRGELQWSYYAEENGVGIHHYLIKNKT